MTIQPLNAVSIDSDYRVITDDQSLTVIGDAVIVEEVFPEPADPTLKQSVRLIELSGVLDFWENPEEDIYNPNDGEPI